MKTTNLSERKSLQAEDAYDHETVALSISSEGAEHLMSTLTNLYSNPAEAVFREVVSNALDSHIKSGQTLPIQVRLDSFSLVVQDFGSGMSKDEIANIYSKYGASTKRDSNTQVGAFGLGAKSPLAIADRFDVSSVKNGVRVDFYVEKNSRGAGVVHFLSEVETSDPNGVKVTIPLNRNSAETMTRLTHAGGFFATWDPSLVRVNGQTIPTEGNVYNKDEFYTLYDGDSILGWIASRSSGSWNPEPSIAIAGIRYDLGRKGSVNGRTDSSLYMNAQAKATVTSLTLAGYRIIINLPLGSVDLTPSREDIMLTDKTTQTLKTRFDALVEEVYRVYRSELNKQHTRADAIKFVANNLAALGVKNASGGTYEYVPEAPEGEFLSLTYKGEKIPFTVPVEAAVIDASTASAWDSRWFSDREINLFAIQNKHPASTARASRNGRTRNHYSYRGVLSPRKYGNLHDSVVVYGKDTEENRKTILRNARSYTADKFGNKYATVYFIQSDVKPSNPWLNALVEVMSIDELAEVGLEYRRRKAKEAAANRENTGPRSKAIHYGIALNDKGEAIVQKFSPDDFVDYKQVVAISEKEAMRHNYTVSDTFMSNFRYEIWNGLTEMFDPKCERDTYTRTFASIVDAIEQVGNDTLFVFVPTTRSLAPIAKAAGDRLTTIERFVIDRINGYKKDKVSAEALRVLSGIPLHADSRMCEHRVLSYLSTPQNLTNKVLNKVATDLQAKGELTALVFLARVLGRATSSINQDGNEAHKASEELRKFLVNGATNELVDRISYITSPVPLNTLNLDHRNMLFTITESVTASVKVK